MKFTVRKSELQKELALGLGVVESKSTIPVLSHLLVRADKNGLELVGTDLEIGMRSRFAADVTEPGSCAVPAKKLHDIVRALDCDVVSFSSDSSNWHRVEGGSFRGRIVGLPDSDFPTQAEFPKDAAAVKVPASILQRMVARTIFAITAENTRFSINGALLEIDATGLTLVATDGHRLAHVAWAQGISGMSADVGILVPRKALVELSRLPVQDENEEIEIATKDNHVFFRTQAKVLHARTLEGTFPAYERVIPAENPVLVRVDRRGFQDMIGRVALLTSDATRLITLSAEGQSLSASAVNTSLGEASEEMAAEHEGGDVKIGLNHEYLQQFLSVVESDAVELRLKDSNTQALLRPVGTAGIAYQYVVMPMRLP